LALRRSPGACLAQAVAAAALVTPLLVFYYLVWMVTSADYS
jgi:hypothetical protein